MVISKGPIQYSTVQYSAELVRKTMLRAWFLGKVVKLVRYVSYLSG